MVVVFGEKETKGVIGLSMASSNRAENCMCNLGSSGSNMIIII